MCIHHGSIEWKLSRRNPQSMLSEFDSKSPRAVGLHTFSLASLMAIGNMFDTRSWKVSVAEQRFTQLWTWLIQACSVQYVHNSATWVFFHSVTPGIWQWISFNPTNGPNQSHQNGHQHPRTGSRRQDQQVAGSQSWARFEAQMLLAWKLMQLKVFQEQWK